MVETATKPPPSSIPSGVRDGTLRDVPSSPDARSGATRPSVPDTAAASAEALAGACAGAAETSDPRGGRDHGERCEESNLRT